MCQCLALLILIIAVPTWWISIAQDVWSSGRMYDNPIELMTAVTGGAMAFVVMCVALCCLFTTLLLLWCGCCYCWPLSGRLSCCNFGGRVKQGRHRYVWVNDELVYEEEVVD